MKKSTLIITLLLVVVFVAAPSHAGAKFDKKESWVCATFPNFCQRIENRFGDDSKKDKKKIKKKFAKKYSGSVAKVPEIDAASAGIALALLAGVVGIRRELKGRRA